jgi:hypothetical protein
MTEPTLHQPQSDSPPSIPASEIVVPENDSLRAPTPEIEVAKEIDETETRASLSPGAIFFGVIVSLGFIAFVLLARVTVHYQDELGDKIDRRMRVLDVWQRLHNHLPEVAHPTLLRVVFDVSIIMIVIGSLACVWLALLAVNVKEPRVETGFTKSSEPQILHSEH